MEKEKNISKSDDKVPKEIPFLKSNPCEALKVFQSIIVNKEISIQKNIEESSVYFCKVCNCSLKDNQAYLDHLNGKRHNKMLGVSMKVEKVDVDTVKSKLLNLKRKSDDMIKSKREMKSENL
jgi:U4/U6.U5 tri-snRNP component SNU23